MNNTNWLRVFLVEFGDAGNAACPASRISRITVRPQAFSSINIHLCGRGCQMTPRPERPGDCVTSCVVTEEELRYIMTT